MQQIRAGGFMPTAILCVNDFMAIGALRELRDAGLEAPRDVSVTGYDNIDLAEYIYPALTTVNIPRRQIGQMIFAALVPDQDGARDNEILIEPELVVRESTAPAPSRELTWNGRRPEQARATSGAPESDRV